ncbi:insulinase family protein [bacterium]|nr:insulinase family protein [bacterium]
MLKIDNISSKINTQPKFSGNTQETKNQQIKNVDSLPAVPSPIGIKAPIIYTYTGEIDILGDLKAQTYKLANGQNIIILPKKGPTVVKTYVNAGSMNEPDNLRGISHYIEHNLFNGTNDLKAGEFFNRVNCLGASTNASTSFSTTDFYISSQLLKNGDLEEKIKLHSDMLQNPIFAPDMLDKERGPVISEISMVMDEPQNVAINLALKNLYQIKTKSPDLIAGTIENIQNITRNDVVNYYNTHYTPDNFTTVITGDVNPNETINLVSKYFTKQNPIKPLEKKFEELTPIEKSLRVDQSSDKATSSTVVLAFAGPENNNTKDKIASEVLITLLTGNKSSRLNKTLEKSHVGIDSGIEKIGNKQNDKKALMLLANCTPEKVDDSIKTIYKEIFNIQNGNITEKEFKITKKQLRRSIESVEENSALLNSLIGSSLLDKDKEYLANYDNILKNITIQDIQEAAQKYLNLNKASISVVNPSKIALNKNSTVSFGNSNKEFVLKEALNTSNITNYRLHNNLEVITNPTQNNSSTFSISLKTPAPAAVKPGVAEILTAMLNRGSATKSKDEFYDEAETKGINIIFKATPSELSSYTDCVAEDTTNALSLTKDVLQNPRLNEDNFNFAKEEIKEIVSKQEKSAKSNAMEDLFQHLPFSASKEKLLESIKDVSLEDVKGLYAYLTQNASAVCTASAAFDKHPELINTFNNSLAEGFPKFQEFNTSLFQSYVPQQKNKIIAQADQRNQADIVKCYKFKTNANISDCAKFKLLNTILGGNPNSRLFNDLREKQKLAYRVRSNVDFFGNTGIMTLSIKTTTDNPLEGNDKLDNVKKSLKGFDVNTQKLQTQKVTDEELESAKLYLKTKILDGAETAAGKNALILEGKQMPYGINTINMLLQEIDKVTKEDIQSAANYIFNNNSLTSIVASQKTLEHFKNTTK